MGWVGVDLFFVLSGFLITRVLLHERGRPDYFRNFYARRILRIWPLYLTITLVAFAVGGRLGPQLAFDNSPRELITYLTYTQNLVHRSHFGVWPLQVSWSLAIEEQFYLVWPLVVRWLHPRVLRSTCLFILAVEPVLRAGVLLRGLAPITVYIFTPLHLDGLAAGGFVATLFAEEMTEEITAALLPIAAVFLALAAAVGILWLGSDSVMIQASPASTTSVVAGMAFIFAGLATGFSAFLLWVLSYRARDTIVHRFLRTSFLRWLGKISYGLYLLHAIVIVVVQLPVRRELESRFNLHGRSATLVELVLEYGASFTLAWLSFNYFEIRFLRLKDRFGSTRKATEYSIAP
jgi:peptidoglycan/LPS O-acetylase OafA/YrhL